MMVSHENQLVNSVMLLSISRSLAQIDTEFWFAAPDIII